MSPVSSGAHILLGHRGKPGCPPGKALVRNNPVVSLVSPQPQASALSQLFRHSPSQIKFRAQSRAKGAVVTRADLSLRPEKEV